MNERQAVLDRLSLLFIIAKFQRLFQHGLRLGVFLLIKEEIAEIPECGVIFPIQIQGFFKVLAALVRIRTRSDSQKNCLIIKILCILKGSG